MWVRRRGRETADNVRSRSVIPIQYLYDCGFTGSRGVAVYNGPGRNRGRSFLSFDRIAQRSGLRTLREICNRAGYGGSKTGACKRRESGES